ncbi:MAG: hypothetical protein GXP27_04800, partial [Planctomycetes bacterium]|nr:hypothetical protein [Planctomycetota bacterium]
MCRGWFATAMAAVLGSTGLLLASTAVAADNECRPTGLSVHPAKPNVVAFEPVRAKLVRFVILGSSRGEPCVDELEIYGPDSDDNLALAKRGAKATASSCLPGYAIHRIEHLNDGRYGNRHSWIAAQKSGWAQIELPEPATIDRVVFSRDREGRYQDRVPVAFEVHVSLDGKDWQVVARVRNTEIVQREAMPLYPNKPVVLDFPAQRTRFVRIVIKRTAGGAQPCIDELEVYGPDKKENLAAAARGAKATASSCITGYAIHKIEHLNDGRYGNDHSWIAAEPTGWAQIELPEPAEVCRVVFARDREGRYRDRMPAEFEIRLSLDGRRWRIVKDIVALENAPIEQPLADEDPRDWAYRIAAELPHQWNAAVQSLIAKVRTADDVRPLLELYDLDRQRRDMLARLPLLFNPAALRRAVKDLSKTYPETFHLPDGFDRTLARYAQQRDQVLKALQTGRPAEIKTALARAEQMIAWARSILLANPLLDFDELLVLKRKLPPDDNKHVYWRWGQRYGLTVNWSCDFRPKNPPIAPHWDDALVALAWRQAGQPMRTIYKPPKGHMIQHPELHWDADRLLFTAPGPKGAFQVFEINLDGTGLRQITCDTGPDVDNGDPCYLPDGRIIFNSTRLFIGVPCEDGQSYVSSLCLTDPDGRHTRLLTIDQESAWHPAVLNDGRVLYTRYEYANVSHQFGRLLFRMNPDGTGQMAYYGTNSYWPNSIFYARPIPGHPTMVIGVVCGHHGPNKTGRLVLFDPARGTRETAGAVQTIPGYSKPVKRTVADVLYGDDWPKFTHPWPLSDKYFLVSARLHPQQLEYAIYLVDVFDNIVEVCRLPGYSLFEPQPIKRRPRPPVIPDRVKPGEKEATIYLVDVYRGEQMRGVPRGTVKKLRLFTYNYVYRHTIRRGFGHLATPGVDGPWEPRFILGTVPVREDGSALFKVPANMPIAVQPLDADGKAVQQMRSWYTAMPGERFTCIGCHERPTETPPSTATLALAGSPDHIEPWRGPPRGFDFELEIQPVLDRYCVGCHDGSQPDRPDFSRKSEEEKLRINQQYHQQTDSTITTILTPSFIALHPYVYRPHAESNYGPQVAGEFCADVSPLVQLL